MPNTETQQSALGAARAALVDGIRQQIKDFKNSEAYKAAQPADQQRLDKTAEKLEKLAKMLDDVFSTVENFMKADATYSKATGIWASAAAFGTLAKTLITLLNDLYTLRTAMTTLVYSQNGPADPLSRALQTQIDGFVTSHLGGSSTIFKLVDEMPTANLQILLNSPMGGAIKSALGLCNLASLDASSANATHADLKFYFAIMLRQLMSPTARAQLPAHDLTDVNNAEKKLKEMALPWPDGTQPNMTEVAQIINVKPPKVSSVQTTPATSEFSDGEESTAAPLSPTWSKKSQVTLYEIQTALNEKIATLKDSPDKKAAYENLKEHVDNLQAIYDESKSSPNATTVLDIVKNTTQMILENTDIKVKGVSENEPSSGITIEKYKAEVAPKLKTLSSGWRARFAAALGAVIGAIIGLGYSKSSAAKGATFLGGHTGALSLGVYGQKTTTEGVAAEVENIKKHTPK